MNQLVNRINGYFNEPMFTVAELQKPYPSLVGTFFLKLMGNFEVDTDNIRTFQMQECNPEDLEILSELNLVAAIRYIFQFLNFGLLDLLNPGQKRTVDLILHSLEFYNFCDERVMKLEDCVIEYRQAQASIIEAMKRKDLISQKLNEVAIEKDSIQLKMNSLRHVAKDKSNTVTELEREVKTIRSEADKLNVIEEKLDSNIATLEAQLFELNTEISNLRNDVVDNPEVDQDNLKQKEAEKEIVQQQKEATWEKLKKKSEDKKQLAAITSAFKSLSQHADVTTLINNTVKKQDLLNTLLDQLSKLQAKEAKEKEIESLDMKISSEEKSLEEMKTSSYKKELELLKLIEENKRIYNEELAKENKNTKIWTETQEEFEKLSEEEQQLHEKFSSQYNTFIKTVDTLSSSILN